MFFVMKRSLLFRLSAVTLILLWSGSFLKGQQVVFSEDFSGFTTGTHTTPSTSDISGSLDSRTGIPGWTGLKVYSAGGEIKLGTASLTGWIETPSVNLDQGELSLKFDISRWPGDESSVQVYLNGTPLGDVISPEDNFQRIMIPVPAGTATGKFKFAGLTKRFFLDNISVEKGNISAINIPGQLSAKPLIYPNPAFDFVRIEGTGSFNRIEIADISGEVLNVIEISEEEKIEIPCGKYPAGIYFIRFYSGRMVYTSRLIKVRSR